MEKTKKITKRDNINLLLTIKEVQESEQLVKFLNHELELLDKKKASTGIDTKKAQEHAEIQELILEGLVQVGEPVTITDLQSKFAPLAEYSNQRISAHLSKLIDMQKVVNTKDKKKSYFSIVA